MFLNGKFHGDICLHQKIKDSHHCLCMLFNMWLKPLTGPIYLISELVGHWLLRMSMQLSRRSTTTLSKYRSHLVLATGCSQTLPIGHWWPVLVICHHCLWWNNLFKYNLIQVRKKGKWIETDTMFYILFLFILCIFRLIDESCIFLNLIYLSKSFLQQYQTQEKIPKWQGPSFSSEMNF